MDDRNTLKLAYINIRGIDKEKATTLINKTKQYDIVALQEIHKIHQNIVNHIEDKLDAIFIYQKTP